MAEAANRDSAVQCLERARDILAHLVGEQEVDYDRAIRLLRKAQHLWPTLPGVQEALRDASEQQRAHARSQQWQQQQAAEQQRRQ